MSILIACYWWEHVPSTCFYAWCILLAGNGCFQNMLPLHQSDFAASAFNSSFWCFLPSSGMDTHQRPDSGRCLLGLFCHIWADNPGRGRIQDQELALASTCFLSAFLHCLFMFMVSDNSSQQMLQQINMAWFQIPCFSPQ